MAIEFSNNPNNERLVSAATFTPGLAHSVSLWLRYTSLVANIRRLLGSVTQFEFRGGNGAGTQPPGQLVNDMYSLSDGAMSVALLTAGPWFHVVFTGERSGGNSITDIYINGVLDSGPFSIAESIPGAALMTLGNRTGVGVTDGLNGLLDDVRIYNRRLSPAEVQSIFAARGRDSVLQGLLSRITFKGVPGTSPVGADSVKDVGPSGNHYTPTGSPVYREKFIGGLRRRVG